MFLPLPDLLPQKHENETTQHPSFTLTPSDYVKL